jgi:hypothetical protein
MVTGGRPDRLLAGSGKRLYMSPAFMKRLCAFIAPFV